MKTHRKILGVSCVVVLCSILAVALWPFTFRPKNDVSWISNENGLRFGDYGVIYSSGFIRTVSPQGDAPCSIEIWFLPGEKMDLNSILDFYTTQNPLQFRIGQSGDNLLVSRDIRDGRDNFRANFIEIDHIFDPATTLLVAVTSDGQKTSVYLNGVRVRTSSRFGLTAKDFDGQAVIGTSPVSNLSWAGKLRGLAIYNRELTPAQIAQDYASWIPSGRVDTGASEAAIAVYAFDERSGSVVHNRIASGPDLYIPDHYLIPHQPFLQRPWKEFRPGWLYWKNNLLNVAAFIPLGFLFCAYLSSGEYRNQAVLKTIVLGGATSVVIEVLQAFLPMRNSGMTDIITNTLGTVVGATSYRSQAVQALWGRLGIAGTGEREMPSS